MSYNDEAGIGPLFYYAFSRATMSRIHSAVLRFLKHLLFALGCAIGTVRGQARSQSLCQAASDDE